MGQYVIHTVGTFWSGENANERALLASCYTSTLKIAETLKVKTIAFPNISTGIYKFPKQEADEITVKTVLNNLKETTLQKIYIVCFDIENEQIYRSIINNIQNENQ